jgi:hypothetical protein
MKSETVICFYVVKEKNKDFRNFVTLSSLTNNKGYNWGF